MSKAIIHDKNSRLDTDFGFNYLQMLTGFTFDEIVKLVGIKTRGKNKGKLKGVLYWKKCVRGGWVNQGMGGWYEDGAKGYVLTPNTKFDHNIDFRIKIDSNLINDSFFKLRREKVWYSFWYNSLKQQFVENHKEIIDYNKSKSGGTFIYKDNVDEEARVDLQEDFFELRTNTNRINQVRERIKQKAKNRIIKSIKEKENE